MPARFHEDRGCGVLVLAGEYTVREAGDALVGGLLAITPAPARGLVVDLSDSAMVSARSSNDIAIAAASMGQMGARFSHRMAIVAPGSLAFGLMRMGSVHAEEAGLTVNVCREFDKALEWVLSGED